MTGRRYPAMWVNGHPYPDPIHIATFAGEVYTSYQLGAVVVADDTGEMRTRGPLSWITYVGAFAGAPTVAVWGAFDPVTMQFTTGGAVQGIVIPDTALSGGAGTMSLGAEVSTDIGGYVSVTDPGFAVAGTAVPSVTPQAAISGALVNVAELIDAATGDHIETDDGEEVFGLVQSLAAVVDGDAVAANPTENLQISFVYRTKAAPATLALYTMGAATTCYFRMRRHWYLAAIPYESFVTDTDSDVEILTQVFRIATFTGAVYSDYPLGAVVIARDTGEERTVGPTAWAASPRYEVLVGAHTLDHMDGGKTFIANSAGGAFQIDLPATPTDLLDTFWRPVIAMGALATNAVTIDGNGNSLYVDGVAAPANQTDLNAPGDSILLLTDGVSYYVFSGGAGNLKRTVVNVATYDTTTGDSFLAITRTATGVCAVRLMDALLAIPGKLVRMKDEGANASVFAVTVTAESGQTIDEDASWPIEGDGEEFGFYHDGVNWFVL